MLIFVEGPDKSGKTMFIENCRKEFGWDTFSLPYPKPEPLVASLTDYFLGLNTMIVEAYKRSLSAGNEKPLLVHRGFISEYAYGWAFGRNVPISLVRWWVQRWPRDHTAVIYMSIPHGEYLKRNDGKDKVDLSQDYAWKMVEQSYQIALEQVVMNEGFPVSVLSGMVEFHHQKKLVEVMNELSSTQARERMQGVPGFSTVSDSR